MSFVTDRIINLITDNKPHEEELIELFKKYNQDVEIDRIHQDRTILIWSIKQKYSDLAIKIIQIYEFECLPNWIDNQDATALFYACKYGFCKVVFKLISHFGKKCLPQQETDKQGTALMVACEANSNKIVSKLIETFGQDCNPSARNLSGETALQIACERGNEKMAIALLDTFGKKCNIKYQACTSSRTALKWCDGSIFWYKPCDFDMRTVALKILNNYYTFEDGERIKISDVSTALDAYEKAIIDERKMNLSYCNYEINTIKKILERIVKMFTLDYENEEKGRVDFPLLNNLKFNDGSNIYSTNKYGEKQRVWLIEHLIEVFKVAVELKDSKIKKIMKENIVKYVNSNIVS